VRADQSFRHDRGGRQDTIGRPPRRSCWTAWQRAATAPVRIASVLGGVTLTGPLLGEVDSTVDVL
jgi:hypothetical protein